MTALSAVLELVAESGAANMRCTQSEDLHVAEYAIEKRIELERAAVNFLRTHGHAMLADARDGERYRWLRDAAESRHNHEGYEDDEASDLTVDLVVWEADGSVAYESCFGTNALDAAIDTALSALGKVGS